MIIFVDMDEVLADTYGKHIELYNEEHAMDLHITQITSGEVWENVPERYQDSIRRHALQPGFFKSLAPMKNSIEVMSELCKKHEVYIATAATQFPNSLLEKSEWLDAHMPFITWQHRIMCGHKHILNGDLLIDDRVYNLERFQGATLLFNSPHNFNDTGYERVTTWLDIAERLL